ncbi:hypothetical protein [Streptomyces rapamycinicus]|uniref:Uncharacterized protein n=2 Tax=Streptomyces rapamycinicus TaxID=1226757 RepID=A0A0A0NT29_STRRN|nr:hypothetical protein [Streptomyces rapamycinicus]AGP60656.1 hypothetical protein M271_46465 [Streptomyces rapamycinicus NRRL 5491]MBB4788179.1 putative membrane protein [Streptomyces rapamycinicus]RLV72514.1 hypothetical protein D3C57_148345 [Streptomyces rapamycinicus NRRL 5491]UTP36202.1 hypothetical protein LIV37_47185 [Streptomyces rapamycinicus NRRL 5491]
MANLPEDIVDRIRALERQVHRLTTYVNSKPGGTPTALAATEPPPPPQARAQAQAQAQTQETSGEEPPRPDGTAPGP